MKQDKAQQAARDEKLVPTEDRVKIGKSNLRMDPTLTQKEETYQVILDIIKNTPCYTAFLITADEFTVPVSNDSLMDFLLDLGYNGPLKHISELFVDHMHQPWRTLRAIINICLSEKIFSNDRLRLSIIEILWGIYHKANVDYAALIWEDLQYQIENRQLKVRRCEIMPYPRFTKAIIHYFMCQHKSISKRQGSPYHTADNDDVLDRLKFISKGDIHQVYGKSFLDTLIIDDIQNFEAYKTLASVQADFSTNLVAQVKELVLDQRFQMSQQKNLQTQMKELGSTDDETFLFDDKDEIIEDIPRVSTDDDETKDDDEEDDASIDIEKTDDERTNIDVKDQVKGVAEINIAKEAEEENVEEVDEPNADEEIKADEEQQGDKQVGDEQVGFLNSPNVSLIGTIQENAEVEIKSLVSELEKDVKELKKVERTLAIRESLKSEVPEAMNKYLGSTLGDTLQKVIQRHTKELRQEFSQKTIGQTHTKDLNLQVSQDDVSKFIKVNQEHTTQEKMPKYSTTPYDQAVNDEHKQKEILFKMMMASKSHEKHPSY
ncbi:hypothetical protein Tco_1449920 [Tanacetum coccineum]